MLKGSSKLNFLKKIQFRIISLYVLITVDVVPTIGNLKITFSRSNCVRTRKGAFRVATRKDPGRITNSASFALFYKNVKWITLNLSLLIYKIYNINGFGLG